MEEYLIRLCRCGMSISEAMSTYFEQVKQGGIDCLEKFIAKLECKKYVD